MRFLRGRAENFCLINDDAALGIGDQLHERVLHSEQSRIRGSALKYDVQPIAIAQIAAAAPFVLGEFDIANSRAALNFNRALIKDG